MEVENFQESLGEFLRKYRESKGVSLEQISYATRIGIKMLRAIEEDDHRLLPAQTFVRGYLQAYAKYVHLDPQDVLLRYQHHLASRPLHPAGQIRSHHLYVSERNQERKKLFLVIALSTAVLICMGTYYVLKAKRDRTKKFAANLAATAVATEKKAADGTNSEPETSAPTPTATATVAVTAAPKPEKEKPAEKIASEKAEKEKLEKERAEKEKAEKEKAEKEKAEKAEKEKAKAAAIAASTNTTTSTQSATAVEKRRYTLAVKSTTEVWLRYQADDDQAKNYILKPDGQLFLRANKVFKIFSGNLGALQVTFNGQPVSNIMQPGRTKSLVLPESEVPNYPPPLFPEVAPANPPPNSETGAGGAEKKAP